MPSQSSRSLLFSSVACLLWRTSSLPLGTSFSWEATPFHLLNRHWQVSSHTADSLEARCLLFGGLVWAVVFFALIFLHNAPEMFRFS